MKLFSSVYRPVLLLMLVVPASGATLPGFDVESVADVPGFISSIVADSRGTLYATTTNGWIHRIEDGHAVTIASLPTRAGGNGGLLGMALIDDDTAAVHYTRWLGPHVVDDVVSLVDLSSGAESPLQAFACDVDVHDRGASDEHHGGNPTIGPDGAIFVGIGEYGEEAIAQDPRWNAGKIFRLHGGTVTQYARGLRNPYDLAWDPEQRQLVVADNGPSGGDEIHIIQEGDNCGWPATVAHQAVPEGMVAPAYVFPATVAPTGMVRLTPDADPLLRRGYLISAFVTRAVYYFPDLAARPIAAPFPLVSGFENFIIDVTQAPGGEIYFASASFASGSRIHRLRVPSRGDCNGDGIADWRDIASLLLELEDGDPQPVVTAQDGSYAGSWGCDANADRVINRTDVSALTRMISRRRAVGTR